MSIPYFFIEITAGLFPILIDEIISFAIIKHDKAGYHWRLWGHVEGKHGGKLSPIISIGKTTYSLLTISALIVPFLFYFLTPSIKTFVISLDTKILFLFLDEFFFTGLWIMHFPMNKISWDKWKIGSLVIFILSVIMLFFWK